MNQSEIAQPPKEVVYQQVLNNLEINQPEPVTGNWNERVSNLLDGEFFLGELQKYVNRPIIVDNIDDHGFRREWRQWAFGQVEDLQARYGDETIKEYARLLLETKNNRVSQPIAELLSSVDSEHPLKTTDIDILTGLSQQELALILYEENALRMNQIMKIDGIIDMLLEIEEPSGNLTDEEVQLLRDTRKEFSKATEKLPVKYDTFTAQEVLADVLKQLIDNEYYPSGH